MALFDNITITRNEQDGDILQQIRVPIEWGPREKFLARTDEREDLDDPVKAIILPRMAVERTGISYDASRQKNKFACVSTLTSVDGDVNKKAKFYTQVPYLFNYSLHIIANTRHDMEQIIEQILPFFAPDFNLSIKPISSQPTILQNIKILLKSIEENDQYEGAFEEIRRYTTTLNFELRGGFFTGISDSEVIKTAIVNYYDYASEDLIKSVEYAVTPQSATEDDSYVIVTTETFGYEP